jgi:hypothetical protein
MPKRFTLAEAQSLIPEVDALLRAAIAAKASYEEAERDLQGLTERIMLMGGLTVNREKALAIRERRETAAASLREAVGSVQGIGCVIKDLDIGLIDFPTLFHGVEVYLCWKLDEPGIAFWHGVDEGFRGRKAIHQDFRDHHRGDAPH